jgi:hypothetical protein
MLGLAKILTQLRNDVTYPGDPGGVLHKHERAACPITSAPQNLSSTGRRVKPPAQVPPTPHPTPPGHTTAEMSNPHDRADPAGIPREP